MGTEPDSKAEKQVVHVSGQTFTNLQQLEALAKPLLTKQAFDYYAGGSETESTVRDNRAAFARYRLFPRVLVDVSNVDMSITLFGCRLSSPILIAPMALQGMAHKDGELATARAAHNTGLGMVVSTMANYSVAEVASSGAQNLFFQVYVLKARELTRQMVLDAERCGYRGIVVTVDAPRLGKREKDERNRFAPPPYLMLKNLVSLRDEFAIRPQASQGSGLEKHFEKQIDDGLTWEFIPWLKTVTKLPIILKGVLHPADAKVALEYSVDGIIVSNHGGRQVDGAPASLDMLPEIVSVVQERVPIIVDGGVRRGTDVFKCLALGASAVLLGRPVLYALAVGGQQGVEAALKLLANELDLTMCLMGCPSLQHVSTDMVLKAGQPYASKL